MTALDKLTPKERRFVHEYLVDMSQGKAALRAGYSEHTCNEIAYELMRRPRVKRAIERAVAEQQLRLLISADQVLLSIQRVGHKAEKKHEYTAALRAFELLAKHYKLLTDKFEVATTLTLQQLVEASLQPKSDEPSGG